MLVVLAACLVAYTLRPPARPHAYAARPSTRIRCAASPFDDIVPVTPDYMTDPVPAALARLGYGRVRRVTDVSPGPELSMAHLRYDTDEGPVYCKRSRRKVDQLADEATSLRVLRSAALAASVLRVPRPLETGELPLGGSFLLLEWVEADAPFGASLPSVLERLGHGLAALHTTPQPPPARGFGFVCDGHLGLDRLSNAWDPSHASFFVKRRLAPQLGAASAPMAAAASAAAWGEEGARRLASRADDLLCAAELLLRPCDTSDPALLHGNLWLGNVGATPDLEPVVFDPACFYGLPEFDLALGEVVGHFGPAFHAAYHSERPRGAGFEERRDLFVLYHLLSRQGADARRGMGPAGPQGYGATPRERGVRLNALVDRVIGSSGLR